MQQQARAEAAPDGLERPAVMQRARVIIITGPTAVGKTAVALRLAERLGGEVISADSVQIYKGLDIGSDKIPVHERRGIKHHLLDIADVQEDFSAGHFFQAAREATRDILRRGKVPIVAGGTGFYLRWFIYGKPRTPESTPEGAAAAKRTIEEAVAQAAEASGGSLSPEDQWRVGMGCVSAAGDPESASKLAEVPNNYYRLLRVLEIVQRTGRRLADLDIDEDAPLDFDFRPFFLHRRRETLYRSIDARCEEMVQRGLLQETKAGLMDAGIAPESCSAARAIGYRQALAHLHKWRDAPATISADSLVELVRAVQTASRQYCHRQLTWARGLPLFKWVDADQGQEAVVEQILSELQAAQHAGDSEQQGRLSLEENKLMKRYQPVLKIFSHQDEIERVLTWLCNTLQTT